MDSHEFPSGKISRESLSSVCISMVYALNLLNIHLSEKKLSAVVIGHKSRDPSAFAKYDSGICMYDHHL